MASGEREVKPAIFVSIMAVLFMFTGTCFAFYCFPSVQEWMLETVGADDQGYDLSAGETPNKKYLAKICETFLPLADLSEKVSQPVDFILRMINDCYSREDIENFTIGFDQYKLLMKESQIKIKTRDIEKALPVIKSALNASEPQDELVFFINSTKNLAIRYLMTSEYYMNDYLEYKLIPARFDGCIDA